MNEATASPLAQKTLVTFLLDRSGSMGDIRDTTISAFNEYLDGLRGDGEDLIAFSLVTFDSQSMDKVCVAVPAATAPRLSRENYVPRSSTPLIDASVITIRAVEASMEMRGSPKVVICIQTDGLENASIDHTWDELKKLVEAKTKDGWQFNFIGAGINAYEQGSKMGVSYAATMSYDTDEASTHSAFKDSAANTVAYATGRAADTSYSPEQKTAAGDKYVGAQQPQSPRQKTMWPRRGRALRGAFSLDDKAAADKFSLTD